MDFIKKNKILTLMAIIAVLSFALEKAGIIQPEISLNYLINNFLMQ